MKCYKQLLRLSSRAESEPVTTSKDADNLRAGQRQQRLSYYSNWFTSPYGRFCDSVLHNVSREKRKPVSRKPALPINRTRTAVVNNSAGNGVDYLTPTT
ncbi:hypothetical protein M514_05831 [Trichuris suis]|uniref:Uncharacterized protein n=1 Tax=Trichuris suis TaxID=68888 RepID=A0A085M804_9BILA|nr:hypothetical protein M513_05831 [Trichuris suis]KFD66445.1 hypothetical protein M514_05831 [Trichuris suis]